MTNITEYFSQFYLRGLWEPFPGAYSGLAPGSVSRDQSGLYSRCYMDSVGDISWKAMCKAIVLCKCLTLVPENTTFDIKKNLRKIVHQSVAIGSVKWEVREVTLRKECFHFSVLFTQATRKMLGMDQA